MIWQGCQKQLFNVIEEMTAERNENTSEVKLDIFEVLTLIIYSYIHIFTYLTERKKETPLG